MNIRIQGARQHNLNSVNAEFTDGLTVVTGVSGSGKTSLVFDTLYHEARRRFMETFSPGTATARLVPAHVEEISGLGPAVAVGQNLLNRNPSSLLVTASGLHPFLRLLFAHYGERSCVCCGASLVVYSQDEIIEHLSELCQSAPIQVAVPFLKGVHGSHSSLMKLLGQHFEPEQLIVDGHPWVGAPLVPAQPHDLELIIADFDEKAAPASIRPVMQQAAALGANAITVRRVGWMQTFAFAPLCTVCGTWFGELRPVHFHQPCPHCDGKGCSQCAGSGMHPLAAATRWNGLRFPELLKLSVDEALRLFTGVDHTLTSARLLQEITRRLEALQEVGLGYVNLDRPSPSLSRGEAQRVRLALTLVSRLEDMLHILDEPTIGLHPADVERLILIFRKLPGPVIFVEHDRTAAAQADQAIDLGPGAGHQGGRIVFSGTPHELWQADTATGRFFSLRQRQPSLPHRPPARQFLTLHGADLRNLQQIDVPFPIGRLSVVTGVSGSGKSTLVEDILYPSLEARQPVGCQRLEGTLLKPVMVDQSPIGRNPRSNPATYTHLADIIRDLFASQSHLSPSHFSFNRPEGACPTCKGLGAIEVSMRYLAPTWVECPDCAGQRFSDEVLDCKVSFEGLPLTIADFYALSVAEISRLFTLENRLPPASLESAGRILNALQDIGLGYLELGQPSPTLSGGEAQRVKLARYLSLKSLSSQLLILDEPSTGLHPQDLAGLLVAFDHLVRAGATIVVVEHNLDIIQAADWIIDLGPGAGPLGGSLLYAGPAQDLANASESVTARAILQEQKIQPRPPGVLQGSPKISVLAVRGARMHNLKNVDVDFPKGKMTVVTGVSGSGKSSLVYDVLEAEARRRYLETLTLYERQGTQEGLEAEVESVSGLGVSISITPERLAYSLRATVGTVTEISHHLAILLATFGQRVCLQCGSPMVRVAEGWSCPQCRSQAPAARSQHFSAATYSAACLKCNGVGSLRLPQPEKLIIHPEKPLLDGAMYSPGFFPNGYLGKPFNGGHYQVLALAERYTFDPFKTPWKEMTPQAQQAFLFGDPEPMQVTSHSRTGRTHTYMARFPGFYGFIRDWDVGGTYTGTVACPECGGARLRPEYLAVMLGGYNIFQMSQMPLSTLDVVMQNLQFPNREHPLEAGSHVSILRELHFLQCVGLGYLNLERTAGTLSAGEVQRIRLAGLLGSGLTSLTLLLDEPTRGLHPREVSALISALQSLRDEGNTVIVVEHDPQVMQAADRLVDVGPGPGIQGGQITAQGTPAEVTRAETLTARWLRGEMKMQTPQPLRQPTDWLSLYGAHANNLCGDALHLPLHRLVGVCGVSGSGKSTLIIDTLGRALAPKKQTTSVAYEPIDPGEYGRMEGAPERVLVVDQSRAGIGSAASYLNLTGPLQALYADSEDARAYGLSPEQLLARCSTCGGRGSITLDMTFLPDVHLPCETCQGTGYLPEAWQVRLNGIALPKVFSLTLDQVYDAFGENENLKRPLTAARQVGLGYLVLNQPGYTLSGGEAQRLKIAQELSRSHPADSLYILDEPTVGQHMQDVSRLAGVLHNLVDEGGSVVIVEHHVHLLAACDWLVELGPGGGPDGGHIIASGTPHSLAAGSTPTAPYLLKVLEEGK